MRSGTTLPPYLGTCIFVVFCVATRIVAVVASLHYLSVRVVHAAPTTNANGGRPFTICEPEGTATDVHGKYAAGVGGLASAAQRQQARVCHRDDPRRIRCRLLW